MKNYFIFNVFLSVGRGTDVVIGDGTLEYHRFVGRVGVGTQVSGSLLFLVSVIQDAVERDLITETTIGTGALCILGWTDTHRPLDPVKTAPYVRVPGIRTRTLDVKVGRRKVRTITWDASEEYFSITAG